MTDLKTVMRARRTSKMLADPSAPPSPQGLRREAIDALVETAGHAPMHYAAASVHRAEGRELTSAAPYRIYKLDGPACRRLLDWLAASPLEPGKIAHMLAAAEALLLVAWTPEPDAPALTGDAVFHGSIVNMEHVAAAGAAIQNLLLLATEAGLLSYWSSGGVLRGPQLFDRLAIPRDQILLGAVFLFPEDPGAAEVMPGKLRDKRGTLSDWSVWRDLA